MSKFYITTPLYYVNGEPHLGSAYTTILADVIARYQKKFGMDVRFLTGIDEHGQKIFDAARKANVNPQDFCDRMADKYIDVWKQLSIDYDVFFRTTDKKHVSFVQNILQQVHDKGDIYLSEYTGWYCTPDERFWTEKDIEDGNCPLCGRPVQQLVEQNYFFRMSNYQEWLIDHIKSNPDMIQPESRKNEVLGFLKQPLSDLCISRPKERLAWGIPIPFDENYVTYVWFDALFNYLSATRIHDNMDAEFWPVDCHLIGKDILTTHAVYWPTFLKAADFNIPKHIFAHGWLLADKGKMSKSQGTVVKPLEMVDKFGVDALRYTLLREMVPEMDAKFSEEILSKRLNSDLANDLGNLYNRLAKMYHKYDWNSYPEGEKHYGFDEPLLDLAQSLHEIVKQAIEKIHPQVAIEEIMQYVRGLNRQTEKLQPWKVDWDKEKLNNVEAIETAKSMKAVILGLASVADILEPIMPSKMGQLKLWINDMQIPEDGESLFPRVDTKKNQPITNDPVQQKAASVPNRVNIDDFAKLDLRVATILHAEKHENADKLLVLKVDIGKEQRQIVAGIANSYSPESLIGRQVVIIANLEPVKLRGVVSQGMLLAGNDKSGFSVITTDHELSDGTKIK